jgi:hypothetical protein
VVYYIVSNILTLQFLCQFAEIVFVMAFVIKSMVNGMVLDVKESETGSGAEVILWPFHGGDNQLWEYKDHMFYSKASGYVSCCILISLS